MFFPKNAQDSTGKSPNAQNVPLFCCRCSIAFQPTSYVQETSALDRAVVPGHLLG